MKELWQNEKSKAGITLALWGVFILFVIILAACGSSKKEPVNELKVNNKDITNKYDALIHSNTGFKMTIESNDQETKRIYDSSFIYDDETEYSGYVEDITGINRFRCDTVCYKVFLDHEEEEPIYYDELIKNINFIKKASNKLEADSDKSYSYKEEGKTLKVHVDDQYITNIVIEAEEEKIVFDINYNKNA